MLNITVQHIVVLRILMQFTITKLYTLHNLFFLASAESLEKHEIGFYDFVRTSNGAFSATIHSIMEEMFADQLVRRRGLELQTKGRDTYYNLAGVLIGYQDYSDRCFHILNRLGNNPDAVNQAVSNHLFFRRAKKGTRIF